MKSSQQSGNGKQALGNRALPITASTTAMAHAKSAKGRTKMIDALFSVCIQIKLPLSGSHMSLTIYVSQGNGAICLAYFQKWTKAWMMSSPLQHVVNVVIFFKTHS